MQTQQLTRFCHTADTHLRDSQYGRRSRGDDFLAAILRTATDVKSKGIDVIINAGDFYDRNVLTTRVFEMSKTLDRHLKSIGVAMFVITGNHDKTTPTWLSTMFPMATEYDGSGGVYCLDDCVADIQNVKFQGIPYQPASVFRNLPDSTFETGADFLVLHQPIQELSVYPSEKDLTLVDLPHDQYCGILLGDIHKPGEFVSPTGSTVHYPGSLEMCSKSEPQDKTWSEWTLVEGVFKVIAQHKIPTRTFITCSVECEDELAILCSRVKECAHEDPVVLVEYDPKVPNVAASLFACVDPTKAIVRANPMVIVKGEKVTIDVDSEYSDMLALKDFIELDESMGQDLLTLGHNLCESNANADALVSEYVDNQITKINHKENNASH